MTRFSGAYLLAVGLPALLVRAAAAQDPAATAPAVTHICLAPAAIEAAPKGMDPVSAVRDAFTSFLTGPSLQVQPLTARLRSQVREEAKIAGCRFLLLPSIKHERKSGGGLLGRVAGGAVQQGASSVAGSAGSTAGRMAAGAAAGAASHAVYQYAAYFRRKDELGLSYRLESGNGDLVLEDSEKRKATSDGEDLLTPLVQRAAESIANAATHPGGGKTR